MRDRQARGKDPYSAGDDISDASDAPSPGGMMMMGGGGGGGGGGAAAHGGGDHHTRYVWPAPKLFFGGKMERERERER
jgi:hypothetical protein